MTELSKNAITVLERRYLKKDKNGKLIETPDGMFRRVAKNIAQADLIYDKKADVKKTEEKFYQMMSNLEFLPNSPTLMNAGRTLQQLSACFVLPIGDSMEEIFSSIKDSAIIHQSGGGVGSSFSNLRPKNSRVASTDGVSSGPISFMKVFNSATDVIKQGGKRRGANLGVLRIDHPDIIEFIGCKTDVNILNNFNISVAITDKFMDALKNETDYDLYNPHTKKNESKLNAKKIFDKIVSAAWQSGEPGIIFIDEVNRHNPMPRTGLIESSNPCGEAMLQSWCACNLGSINLNRVLKKKNGVLIIDWNKLEKIVWKAVYFLDNVIDMNKFPLDIIGKKTKDSRQIGLGVMGFADMLIELGIAYNSKEGVETAKDCMSFINRVAMVASGDLSTDRGRFPDYKGSVYEYEKGNEDFKFYGNDFRNATRTAIAPTGTISIIANCSSGIEPLFALSYVRNVMDNDKLIEVNPIFERIAKERGFYSKKLMERVATDGIQDLKEIPDDVKKIFVTSHEISSEWHIKMQAVFQENVDNAVSKTINFSKDATKEDIREAYLMAYELKCKGITVYRDGSRDNQVLTTKKKKDDKKFDIKYNVRPKVVKGTTQKIKTGCGNLYITINEHEGKPFEVFNQMGKAGGCAASQSEAIGRLVSLAMRYGVKIEEIVKQIVGISCHMPTWDDGKKVLSCADAISKAIDNYFQDKDIIKNKKVFEICPDCGGQLEKSEGCVICKGCGFSKCS